MPSIINSDDGVISGTSGLKTTGGNDGALNIQAKGTNAISISAAGAVTLPAGALPVGSGGTGTTTLTANNVILGNGASAVQFVAPGASGNVLQSNGTTWASATLSSYVGTRATVYTGNATFTIPTGITQLKVTVVGAGGGGGGSTGGTAAGGGSGGTAIKWLTGLTPGNTLAVTVGTAGTAGAATPTAGGNGGNSTVASGTQTISTITGNGGTGGSQATGANQNGVAGGTATGGDINIGGQNSAGSGGTAAGTRGGANMYGNAGVLTAQSTTSAATGYGAGGGAGWNSAGGAGGGGLVIFEY